MQFFQIPTRAIVKGYSTLLYSSNLHSINHFRHISFSNSSLKSSSRKRNSSKFGNLSKTTDSCKHSLISHSSELPSQSDLDNTLLELNEYSSEVPLEQINWSWQAYAALDGLLCLYKEPDQPSEELIPLVQRAIVCGLNAMPHNPERHVVRVERLPLTTRIHTRQATPAITSERSPSLETSHSSPIANAIPINTSATDSMIHLDSDSFRSDVLRENHSSNMESLLALNLDISLKTKQPSLPCKYVVHTEPDWSDSRLALGPRYLPEDITVVSISPLQSWSSGVSLFAIGPNAEDLAERVRFCKYPRVYHIGVELGRSTRDFLSSSPTMLRTPTNHVSRYRLDRVLAALRSQHMQHMYSSLGVSLQSQQAYELAASGQLLRPTGPEDTEAPLLYALKCLDFKRPHAILEVHAVNESCAYLLQLVDYLGTRLRTTAVLTRSRRLRFGHYKAAEHSLLARPAHLSLAALLRNVRLCTALYAAREPAAARPGGAFTPTLRALHK